MDLDTEVGWLRDNSFNIHSWAEFEADLDKPEGLLERALEFKSDWIIWDPYDDKEGFLLLGPDRSRLIQDAYERLKVHE